MHTQTGHESLIEIDFFLFAPYFPTRFLKSLIFG